MIREQFQPQSKPETIRTRVCRGWHSWRHERLKEQPANILVLQARKPGSGRLDQERDDLTKIAEGTGAILTFINVLDPDDPLYHTLTNPKSLVDKSSYSAVVLAGSDVVTLSHADKLTEVEIESAVYTKLVNLRTEHITPEGEIIISDELRRVEEKLEKAKLAKQYSDIVDPIATESIKRGSRLWNPTQILGLCLGAQEIHKIGGGKVTSAHGRRDRYEVGIAPLRLTRRGKKDPYIQAVLNAIPTEIRGDNATINTVVVHHDVIEKPAKRFNTLGQTPYDTYSLTRRRKIWAAQPHIEFKGSDLQEAFRRMSETQGAEQYHDGPNLRLPHELTHATSADYAPEFVRAFFTDVATQTLRRRILTAPHTILRRRKLSLTA